MNNPGIILALIVASFTVDGAEKAVAAGPDDLCSKIGALIEIQAGQKLVLFARGVSISDYSALDGIGIAGEFDKLADSYKSMNARVAWADVGTNILWAKPGISNADAQTLNEAVLFLYADSSRSVRSAAYLNYLEYKSRYTKLLSQLQNPPGHVLLPAEQAQVQQAKDDFELLGRRGDVEKYIGIIEKFDADAAVPEQGPFEQSIFYATHPDQTRYTYSPALGDLFLSDTGWKLLTITSPPNDPAQYSPSTSACGDPIFSFPIVGGGVLGAASTVNSDSTVRMDIAIQAVKVTRPWPSRELLASHRWKLKNDQILSNGTLDDPKGILPRIPVEFVVAAHGTYISDTPTKVRKAVIGAISKKTPFSLLSPFVAGAPEDVGDNVGDFLRPTGIAAGIAADFPQVIGVVIEGLPKSPNPDDGLTWDD